MRAVIFDMGRVLVHWDSQATLAGLAEISQAKPAELQSLLHEIGHDLGTGTLTAAQIHRCLVERAGATTDWDQFYAAFCCGICRDNPALRYAAHLAERGVPLGIISNTNAIHVQWLRAHLPELTSFRWALWSSDVGLLKPDRAIYDLAIRQWEVAPARTLFVDDLEEHVAGAAAAGLAGWVHRDWHETKPVVEDWLNT